ncbi:BZ3500_MvSof-1268-A1-R1_Chr3-1g06154 [Microbotryum saponariae]|uniref:BZ3500_MvSof-1268-A1-R1_Chr3-1g06154 protein n=1 Tax=Microbotryum saponariae TaxID=289078 RepID=A0A2X0NFV6_9BASI|nr:BZ3500_MvSof-1268-A1-R1_Chr3-1g06154 [Microbotryum saponariae]SDA04017.1 BZ3501_MvSof-1269-A2-R1_Chr3-2g05839 [Microbotryum saponariae]
MRFRSFLLSFSILIIALASPSLFARLGQIVRHMSSSSTSASSSGTAQTTRTGIKNLVVVGASYVGMMAAKELMTKLDGEQQKKDSYRVVVVEKQSHFSHLFAKRISSITPHSSLLLDRPVQFEGNKVTELPFEALVLASGTKLTPPGTMPSEEKLEGVKYLQGVQEELEKAHDLVILGGGAVGVRELIFSNHNDEMATDLAILYPEKSITVVQSRTLMPRFHPQLHELVMKRFQELGIKTILGSRAVIPAEGFNVEGREGKQAVRTQNGDEVKADYVIESTGQTPNSAYLASFAASTLTPGKYVRVTSALQVDTQGVEDEEVKKVAGRIFAVGDIADSGELRGEIAGAPKAARPGMAQATIVANNIAKLLAGEEASSFETYHPNPAAIHLTLGFAESVIFRNPPSTNPEDVLGSFEGDPVIMVKDDGKKDMGIEGVWERRAPGLVKSQDDYWL